MSDTEEIIKCPACGNEMTKIFIQGKCINIDICDKGCGGIFFDNTEIQEFSGENDDISEIMQVISNKNFMPADENKTRICPSCKTPMVKTNVFGVQIDTCYKCGGIFLDNGEFQRVRTSFKKRKKVQPVVLDPNNDFTIQDFYKDAQNEERRQRQNLRCGAKMLGLIFRLFI